jgi:hypothetical protein
LFAVVTTRPNIAFVALRLACFLVNLGTEYYNATNCVLLYLTRTKALALKLSRGKDLEVASNALFADNTLDRKSLQRYTIKLFSRLIT